MGNNIEIAEIFIRDEYIVFEISCCWPHANTSFDSIQCIFVFLLFHSHLFGDMRQKRAVKNNSFFFKNHQLGIRYT